MRRIILKQPGKIVFGAGCLNELSEDVLVSEKERLLFLIAMPVVKAFDGIITKLKGLGKKVEVVEYNFPGEPSFTLFDKLIEKSVEFKPECVIGAGGGSVLDCAKLLAALTGSSQNVRDVPGINILKGRNISLICIPTTSGTGSEMSPNAILLKEETNEKLGIISPDLVPDACYIDPELTLSLPRKFTAETGMDALCHCIEAYTNKFSHPAVDLYALKGIELISANLLRACENGADVEARSALSLASMYGGLCLGPVNTSAVHALSYGLGGKFHISHGLANAILLPEVLRFNMPSAVSKTANIALAMGVKACATEEETAVAGIEFISKLSSSCGIPQHLSEIGIAPDSFGELATIALNVKRLMNNNPREVSFDDAVGIYNAIL